MAFIENPEGKPYINHIDGNKANNRVENLEWCTQQENIAHAIKTGLTNHEKPIINLDTGEVFSGLQAAARYYGKSAGNLHGALNGRQKTWAGFHWEYTNQGYFLAHPSEAA